MLYHAKQIMYDYLLLNKDYTINNALAWGNCLNHAHQAWTNPYLKKRLFHAIVALVESIPIIGQIASLFEMTAARLFKPYDSLSDLTSRNIRQIEGQEKPFPHQARIIKAPAPFPEKFDITFPSEIKDLPEALFFFHRYIDSQYSALPWPEKMQKILIFTHLSGGKGDLAAAGKVIALMQRICPDLIFDWAVIAACYDPTYQPHLFLNGADHSKVHVRCSPTVYGGSKPKDESPADMVVTGPFSLCDHSCEEIEKTINRPIKGPVFSFQENAQFLWQLNSHETQEIISDGRKGHRSNEEIYQKLHPIIFPSTATRERSTLPMGIQPGSGVFLDTARIKAPLSRGYCCPSYLLQIQDAQLRDDILIAMNVFDQGTQPDYDQHSFNSGYAHASATWARFIDCVAMHEKKKHVVIVLNQEGAVHQLSTPTFQSEIFTQKRLAFLKQKGFGDILLKGEKPQTFAVQKAANPQQERRLIVIIRKFFSPNDMKCMQLASERLLATGDNSAAEAWCSRCKLYLYEDVNNAGCKWRFLQQQVDLAKTISPNLSRLLTLFGGGLRINIPPHEPRSEDQMAEIEELLNDPNISDATLQFCDEIVSNYSFDTVLEGALKRTAWHNYIPELAQIEASALDENFRTGLMEYLDNPNTAKKEFCVSQIPAMGVNIKKAIEQHFEKLPAEAGKFSEDLRN